MLDRHGFSALTLGHPVLTSPYQSSQKLRRNRGRTWGLLGALWPEAWLLLWLLWIGKCMSMAQSQSKIRTANLLRFPQDFIEVTDFYRRWQLKERGLPQKRRLFQSPWASELPATNSVSHRVSAQLRLPQDWRQVRPTWVQGRTSLWWVEGKLHFVSVAPVVLDCPVK